jgi:hypothetical protein
MGFYINPPDMSKEAFLQKYGERLERVPSSHIDENARTMVVCLVDNGMFTAAGICDCKQELEAFASPDHRMKYWFAVPLEKLEPYLGR